LAAQAAKTGSISPTVAAIGSADKAENKMNKVKAGADSSPFEPGTQEYEFAKRMVGIDDNGKKTDITLPFDKSMQLYSSMGGSIGNRSRLLSTAYQLDPKYSAQGSIAKEKFATSHAVKSATLTPDIISGEANKANAVAAAKLEPNVTSPTIEKQARGNTAKVLNNQRSAAARALSTFEDAKNKTNGNYDNVPDFMYRDLASDYAKMLVASGQMSEGSVDKVMQGSASGAVVKLWNYATGDTKTTAPQKVLSLMHDRIKALSTDLDKQYYNQVQGTNLPVNSNQNTNPLRTSQDRSIPKVTDASSYKSVSSGSQYYDPDGNLRTKP
jgi:hypothetical protein